ncbi:hypothetical protein DL769_009164 [Monosporascus sp. CRB-8-3]|nr:hypothetical protein DL769_009164 [Monosporascus sp. CRB-8-3]
MFEETDELIVCPGVYDGLSTRTAIELDSNAILGAGTTASRLGQPDLTIAQLHEMRENAEMIANLDLFGPPLVADVDTDHGGPIMAARTSRTIHPRRRSESDLEYRVLSKRCGHLSSKKLIPQDEYLAEYVQHTPHARSYNPASC